MKRRSWSPAADANLRELYAKEPLSRLAFLFKRTETAVRSRAKVLGTKRSTVSPYTPDEIAFLRAKYPNTQTTQVALALNRPVDSIYRAAKRYGIEKTPEYMASPAACRLRRGDRVGEEFRFPKGHVPANKGLRLPGWGPGRMRETQFKKGRLAHEARNYVPIGTEKIDAKRNVLMRKMTDDPSLAPVMRWTPVHVLVWQAANGAVPHRHICIFKRGMKTFVANEITVDKLEVVSFAENMRRNTIHNLPAPLPQLIQLRSALNRKINRRTRRAEQDGRPA